MIKKLLNKINKQPISFQFLVIGILCLFLYVFSLLGYLQIVGVYSVATIKEAKLTSEGVLYTYSFYYEGKEFTGCFTGVGERIGEKYFVIFSQSNPDKNLLKYNDPVPNCFKDSIYNIWNSIPKCPK